MTIYEIKRNYERNNPKGHFFSRKTMKFFGDTMKNFGVNTIYIDGVKHYVVYRKKPVKHGIKSKYLFGPEFEYLGSAEIDFFSISTN